MAPFRELPPVTRGLVVACFAGWLARLLFPKVTLYFGLVPVLFTGGWLWQAVTYIFLHADIWHFIFNSFMIWMLGRIVEPAMGSRKFLIYFLGCGAAAALLTAAWTPGSPIPVIGASGAVYGLLGAFAFLYPAAQVYLYFLFPVSARTMAILLGILEFVMTLSRTGSRISSITHLGGLAAGLLWLWAERRRGERPVYEAPDPGELEREEIDRLLEKVSRLGQGGLSRSELERLDDYAKRKGGRA
jgi:membrane associated rhomboid family serine protease